MKLRSPHNLFSYNEHFHFNSQCPLYISLQGFTQVYNCVLCKFVLCFVNQNVPGNNFPQLTNINYDLRT